MTSISDEILGKVRDLVPVLAERHAESLEMRDLPAATFEDFKRLGLLNLLAPKRFGGREAPYAVFSRAVQAMVWGCASSAWVFGVLNEHAWVIACFEERAQLDVWGDGKGAVAASSLAPRATAERVDGGWTLNGTWPFSSGSTYADWLLVGALCAGDNGAKYVRLFLIPKSVAEMVDDWDVLGLRGTGSRSFTLHNVFVPDYRTVLSTDLIAGTTPGRFVHPDYPLVRAPRNLFCWFSQPPVMIGLAERAYETVVPVTGSRVSLGIFSMGSSEYVQVQVGGAAAHVRAAVHVIDCAREEAAALLAGGGQITNADVTRIRSDIVMAQRLARSAVDTLVEIAGAKMVYDTHPLQEIVRDLMTVSTHLAASWHQSMVQYGAIQVGAEPLKVFVDAIH